MILYLLDTDTFSLLERGSLALEQRILALPPTTVSLTVITVEEQMNGRLTRLRQAKTAEETIRAYQWLVWSTEALKRLPIRTFDANSLARFEQLRAMKLNVGSMDLRIAAIALEVGATIITRNLRDFSRIPGLSIENWADEQPPNSAI